jgi:hypothetical protein
LHLKSCSSASSRFSCHSLNLKILILCSETQFLKAC